MYLTVSYFSTKINIFVDFDAWLTNIGAVCGNEVCTVATPKEFTGENIATIEMLNILVALNVWCSKWANFSVRIACDNEAVVKVLNSGHTKCPQLAKIARNIFMTAAVHDIDLTIVHIPGKQNEVADLLSRWKNTKDNRELLKKFLKHHVWVDISESHLMVDSCI